MLLSARLLRETDLSLDTIATRVGYGSAFAFSKAFSRAWGAPPDRYRRAERAQRTLDTHAPPRSKARAGRAQR